MIEEDTQDLIIAALLDPAKSGNLAAGIAGDADAVAYADAALETIAALAHAAPLHQPPPHIRAKVLAAARGETEAPPITAPRAASRPKSRLPWLPWAIAAGLAILAAVLHSDRDHARSEAARIGAEIERMQRDLIQARAQSEASAAEAAARAGRIAELQRTVEGWKNRDALAEVRIASLTAQVATFARAGVVIVWDAEQQRGVVKLTSMPKADAGKDYQLWVIDPKYPAPVSAGVLLVSASGPSYASFSPAQRIASADKFAISVEKSGGATAPAGPIVFLGD